MDRTPDLVAGRPSRPRALTPEGVRPRRVTVWRVIYRSAYNFRLVRVFTKVPYGGVFALTEQLTRAVTTGEILWFRIDPAKSAELTPGVRERLQRWPEALRESSRKSAVTWLA